MCTRIECPGGKWEYVELYGKCKTLLAGVKSPVLQSEN
jgi:hypothetical protein